MISKDANSPLTAPVVSCRDGPILYLPCAHTLPCSFVCPWLTWSSGEDGVESTCAHWIFGALCWQCHLWSGLWSVTTGVCGPVPSAHGRVTFWSPWVGSIVPTLSLQSQSPSHTLQPLHSDPSLQPSHDASVAQQPSVGTHLSPPHIMCRQGSQGAAPGSLSDLPPLHIDCNRIGPRILCGPVQNEREAPRSKSY